jgi:hypothetical protein
MNASTELNTCDNRFYIYDCNGGIVGNPKGYPTIKGAIRQQNMPGSKAYNAIWKSYYNRKNPKDTFVSKVTQGSFFRAVY